MSCVYITIYCDILRLSISLLTVFHPRSSIRGLLGASSLLFIIILAARFRRFCNWLISVQPVLPQTAAALKVGFAMPVWRLYKISFGRKDLTCFRNQTALETFAETALIFSFQWKEQSVCKPRYFILLTTSRGTNERV